MLRLSQYLLLQTASDDSLVRLKKTALAEQQQELMRLYFSEHHDSVVDFVRHHIQQNDTGSQEGLLMQVYIRTISQSFTLNLYFEVLLGKLMTTVTNLQFYRSSTGYQTVLHDCAKCMAIGLKCMIILFMSQIIGHYT